MQEKITLNFARSLEELLTQTLTVATGTGLIADQYLKNLRTARDNVIVRFHSMSKESK
jgi:hypothetical protein